MERFEVLSVGSPSWKDVIAYAKQCSWSAGPYLARQMESGAFSDWERVIAAWDEDQPCGFCTVTKTDCLQDAPYTPYIGFVFVDESYRGRRLSQRMLRAAMDYLRSVGFSQVYLVSDHAGLYEKYGFQAVDRRFSPTVGGMETVYAHSL